MIALIHDLIRGLSRTKDPIRVLQRRAMVLGAKHFTRAAVDKLLRETVHVRTGAWTKERVT